jgi:hypothetical protein
MSKVFASSRHRYRASAAERRMYGGATVTEFFVYRAEDRGDASKWKIVVGYGKTPGERKTDAIRRSGLVEGAPSADRDRSGRSRSVERPAEVSKLAGVVYDHSDKARLSADFERHGWHFVSENESSGAWIVRRGAIEVLIAFGGPRRAARAFWWREVGGPSHRI